MSVGGIEAPAHVFGEVTDIASLGDSGAVAVDRQARAVFVFDDEGNLAMTLGREGEGPGEFLDPIALEVRGAQVSVWDWGQKRITIFDLGLDSVETVAVTSQLNPTHHFGRLSDRRFVFGAATGQLIDESAGSQFWIRDLGVVVFDPVTQRADTVLEIPDDEVGWVDQAERRVGSPHFSPRADFTVSGGELYWSRGDVPLVLGGPPSGPDSIRWDQPLEPVTDSHVDAYREAWLARRPETFHAQINRLFEVMPAAETFPAVRRLVRDRENGIWVQGYAKPGAETHELIRFAAGRLDCRAELPVAFQPEEGGRDWLLGTVTDDLGVERIERWTLRRSRPDL